MTAGLEAASRLHQDLIAVDTHVDTILRVVDIGHDLGQGGSSGYMDLPAMQAGNLSAAFFACWVDPAFVRAGRGRERLFQLVEAVRDLCARHPDRIGLARTGGDIRRLRGEGRLAALLAVEGAHPIETTPGDIAALAEAGMRYFSLAHFHSNAWTDSSTGARLHGGLSQAGRDAIRELDRHAVATDVSHVSDEAFWQILAASRRPVIASHSSARSITDHPRNLTDDMMRALAREGGLVGITWWPEYISARYSRSLDELVQEMRAKQGETGPEPASAIAYLLDMTGGDPKRQYGLLLDAGVPGPTLAELLDHIEHAVEVAGIDHVCLGSDHGAIHFELDGLRTCRDLVHLTAGLLDRGFSEEDVRKIQGENALAFLARLGSS